MELIILAPLALGGGGDLLNMVETQTYWQMQGTTVSVQTLSVYLNDQQNHNANVDALIRQLGDADYQVRETASKKLQALGKDAEAALRKATQSTDPEIQLRAGELLKKIGKKKSDIKVTRLMAIRTLGELKDPAALPLLEKLTHSPDLFEADYARRAISMIKTGRYVRATVKSALLKKHLWMLPKECGYVAQFNSSRAPGISAKDIFDLMKTFPDADHIDELKQQMTKEIVEGAVQIGNVRLKAATIGVAQDVGSDSGFVIVILHGLYDKTTLAKFILNTKSNCPVKPTGLPGVKMYQPEDSIALIPVSNEVLILMAGPNEKAMPVASMLAALKNGKGTLDQNSAMKELIGRADTTKSAWLAARITDKFWENMPMKRDMIPLGTFQNLTVSFDINDKGADIVAVGRGKDATNVAASATMIQAWAQMGATMLKQEVVPEFPPAQNIVNFLETIKYEPKDTTLTVTAHYTGNATRDIISLPMMFLASMGASAAPPLPPPQPAVQIQQARPVPAPAGGADKPIAR